MKYRYVSLLSFIIILALLTFSASAQPGGYKDRLARVRDLVNSNELIMIWSQGLSYNDYNCYQRIFDLDLTQPGGVDSTLVRKPLQIDSAITGNLNLAVASGNFLGGKFKNFVAAWSGPGDTVLVRVPHIDPGTLSWTDASELSIPGLTPIGTKRKIHVATGDFFGDRKDEFVLAFHGADSTIHLQVFSFNPGSLDPQPRGSINDEHTMTSASNLANWDIVTGDFDSDGYHDIALLFVKPLGGSNWALYANIYSVDDQGNIILKASQEVFPMPSYQVYDVNIAGASGALDRDAALEIAFGFCFFQGEQQGPDTYVYLLDVRNGLNTIVVSDSQRVERNTVGPNEMEPLDVAVGDLNNDSRDELILMSGGTFYVYSVDDQLRPQYKTQKSVSINGDSRHSDSFLEMADMDLDERSEIIVAKSWPGAGDPGDLQHFDIHVFSMDSLLTTFTLKAQRLNELPILASPGRRHFAIAMGDFDGDRVRLGEPTHYRRVGVTQPTVILYTPPIHYDMFDTTAFDLSGCYPDQMCGFSSTYIQSTIIDTTVETEIHEDWGGDIQITSAQFALQERMKATYGDKFSYRQGSSTTKTITTGRVAAGDDWIYANVYDIDFYEYPVYDSLNTILGYFMVTIPGTPTPLWVEGKDDYTLGNQFRADHEPGNILSYSTANTSDTSAVIVDFPQQTVGATGNSFVSLEITSFRTSGVDSSWDAGLEVGATVDAMGDIAGFSAGLEVEANGHYNYGELYTQTVKVGESLEMRGDLAHLHPQYGTSGTYHVQPYAYWTSYGALVLDYKVMPLPTGGNSFWEARYGGKVDLAFSLPWRYDAQKGYPYPGNDPSYEFRSRDIALSKSEPVGGDTVTIGARIRNWGLQAVNPPVTVRFYNGDPAAGGTLIQETVMDTIIPPRGSRNVFAQWGIPLNQPLANSRVYVEIDPNNQITNEVHENNNMGWAPAIALGNVTGVKTYPQPPLGFALYQSYPNPFNPVANIKYSIPKRDRTTVKVYDILGREVATLVDENQNPGTHIVQFDGSSFASGVYFYTIRSGSFLETKKMILLK